jgi:hypothetical protein
MIPKADFNVKKKMQDFSESEKSLITPLPAGPGPDRGRGRQGLRTDYTD